MERFTLFLSEQEMSALESIASAELRNFREQARLIIKQELERRGLLVVQETKSQKVAIGAHAHKGSTI